jgi:flagellar biogenesis protein FliO
MLCSSFVCAQQDLGPQWPGPTAQPAPEIGRQSITEQVSQQVPDPSNTPVVEAGVERIESSQPLGLPRRSNESKSIAVQTTDDAQPALGVSWARIAGALGLTLALAIGVLALLRKLSLGRDALGSARAPSGLVEVLARYPLAPRQNLIVLKLDRRVLLLSHSVGGRGEASSVRTLTEIVEPEEVASILLKTRDDEGDTIAARFREAMDKQAAAHDAFEHSSTGNGHARRPAHVAVRTGAGRLAELA